MSSEFKFVEILEIYITCIFFTNNPSDNNGKLFLRWCEKLYILICIKRKRKYENLLLFFLMSLILKMGGFVYKYGNYTSPL